MTTETQLLELWERGYNATPIERALLLSAAANPGLTAEELLDLPIGLRDGKLILFRSALFGHHVSSTANCPKCQTRLELSFNLNPMIELTNQYTTTSFPVVWQGLQIEVRCPNTRDIINVARSRSAKHEAMLLEKCIVDRPLALSELNESESLNDMIAATIEQHDPLGDIEFSMHCTDCSHNFQTPFDIVSFLWTELNAWCQRLMSSIHLLARSYSWTERDVLLLSPWRRQVYLNMIRQ